MTSSAPGATLSGDTETFTWQDTTSTATEYWLNIGSSVGASDYYNSGNLNSATSDTVTGLPIDGSTTVFVRLWYRAGNSGPWQYIDEAYTAGSAGAPGITSHTPLGTFTNISGTETIEWIDNGANATEFWIYAGSGPGGREYADSGSIGNSLSATLSGLPTNGLDVYIRLWYRTSSGSWSYVDEQYIAVTALPTVTTSDGTGILTTPNDTFIWTDPTGTVTTWWLHIGTSQSGREIEDSGNLGSATSYTTQSSNLPAGGVPVYVRLWYRQATGSWQYVDQEFTSAP